jgi:mevalonate kinase
MVVHKEIEFAGERVSVATTLDKDSAEAKKIVAQGKPSGLDTVLSQWTQLKQMTTFDKSKVDWERDKAVVGDEHELAQARKNGFLEKAQFLKQVDLNQYERERDERLRLAAGRHRSAAQ